jgi:hypothetical protein
LLQNKGAGFLQNWQQKLFRSSLLKKSGSINFKRSIEVIFKGFAKKHSFLQNFFPGFIPDPFFSLVL